MIRFVAVMLSALLLALPALADEAHHKTDALTEGEVRKVDKDAKKITIQHEALRNLDMPAMTMVFKVKNEAMLEQVKAGDKVKFEAEKLDGAFTVTKIERAK